MKTTTLVRLAVFAVTAGFLATPLANAQFSPVAINITLKSKAKHKATSNTSEEHTDEKSLEVTLQNTSSKPYGDVTVKYFLFAADLKSKAISVMGAGEKKAELAPTRSVTVETEPASATYTPEHRKGYGRRSTAVPASGQKYKGYGVQVFQGDTLLAEVFNPPTMKQHAGTAPAAPATAKPPPKRGKK